MNYKIKTLEEEFKTIKTAKEERSQRIKKILKINLKIVHQNKNGNL